MTDWWAVLGDGIAPRITRQDEEEDAAIILWLWQMVTDLIPQSARDVAQCAPRIAALLAEERLRYRDLVVFVTHQAVQFHDDLRDKGVPAETALTEAAHLFDAVFAALQVDSMEALQDQVGSVRDPLPGSLGYRRSAQRRAP
jgi:hypothetical protein